MFILSWYGPMGHPTTHSLSIYFSFVWPHKDMVWHRDFARFGTESRDQSVSLVSTTVLL